MSHGDTITSVIRDRQLAIRRELDRRHIHLKVVSADSGIPYPTLVSYFPGEQDRQPAVMPISALYRLIGVLPDDLIDLLLPTGRMIIAVPEGVDHDTLAAKCGEFALSYAHARHPHSEAGVDIGPGENTDLSAKAAGLGATH
jgi:hypothetical protein